MRKNILWLVSLSTLVFVLMGCSAAGSLDATSWRLETYVDDTGTMADVLPDSVVTLDFQAEQVSGNASCNNYNGKKSNLASWPQLAKSVLNPRGLWTRNMPI